MRRRASERREDMGDFGPGVRYPTGKQISQATKDREAVARDERGLGDKIASGYLFVSAVIAIILLIILITYPLWYPALTS